MRPRALVLVVLAAALAACRPAAPVVDEARARAHIDMLAGTIGSRPTGSAANTRARLYLVAELERLGFAVRVQETLAVDPTQGISAPVANIIAVKDGERRDAIALISHYDSVPESTGAQDDGMGVAACLEAARELLSRPMRHSLLVIITDAEELGLLGARVVVSDADVAGRVRAFLNFDGTGASGPALLFEVGPGRGAPLDAWAAGAASPEGASYTTEIYKRLPNDTDFTVFKALDTSGLNFAPVGDSYQYHTDRDVPARVSTATVRHQIVSAVTSVRAIDAREFTTDPTSTPTYFDLAGFRAVVYGPGVATAIAIAAFVVGVLVWLRVTRDLWRARRLSGVILTGLWALLTAVTSVGSMIVAVAALRAVRAELTPWYAEPQWFFIFVAACGAAGTWVAIRLAAIVPERDRPPRHPEATWWVTLPCWIGLGVFLQRAAPTAAYLVTLPLLTAGALLLLLHQTAGRQRIASLVTFGVAAFFALSDLPRLLAFLVPLFGWLPAVAPVWLFPAVFAAAAIVAAPPLLAALAGLSLRWLAPARVGAALAFVVLASGAQAFRAPAYTADRPERRAARYVQDDVRSEAWWEVGGLELGPDLAGTGPEGARWLRVTDAPTASVRLARLSQPFVFRTASAIASQTPGTVRGVVTRRGSDRLQVEVTIVPHESVIARLVLPRDLMPTESTLAGQVGAGQWSATYVAPPASGLTARLVFDGWTASDPPPILVTLTSLGLPGGEGRLRLPSWLPQATTTWRARSVYIVEVPLQQGPGS